MQGRSQTFQNEGAARGAQGWARGADWDPKWRLSIDLCTKCYFIGGQEGGQSFCQGGWLPPCPPPLWLRHWVTWKVASSVKDKVCYALMALTFQTLYWKLPGEIENEVIYYIPTSWPYAELAKRQIHVAVKIQIKSILTTLTIPVASIIIIP